MRATLRHSLLLLLAAPLLLQAQVLPEFNMSDTTVTICKGILLDSEAGPGGNIYGNNEDLTFTIDAGSTITMVFQPTFCLEQGYDRLTFHDGPTINSPQIGPVYSGVVAPPPIVATSGVLTIHFVSDQSVAYCGFEAQWRAEAEPPVPPVMSIVTPPACNSSGLTVGFSYAIPCDSIAAGAFGLNGVQAPEVISATPIACSGGSTAQLQLGVDPAFDRNCPYTLSFRIGLRDRCDSLWFFTLTAQTQVSTCPVQVEILAAQDTICAGDCVALRADVNGCNAYTYSWNGGLPSVAGPISACPTVTTTYSVTVAEQGTGQTATASRTITVIDPQIIGAPTTICQSLNAFDLVATPPGGWWEGPGILDTLIGTLDPDTAGPGLHVITYTLPGGCAAELLLTVDSMDAGFDVAACPGTAPFAFSEFSPQGGAWSGPFTTPNGVFDPSIIGSYLVTYSAGNCSDVLTVNVDHVMANTGLDTVCQSTYPFDIPVYPFGGRWRGAGVVDSIYGTFDPDEAGGGDHVIRYVMQGCDTEFTIHVKPVDIGGDRSACPSMPAPYTLVPAAVPPGGTWTGDGIVDADLGTYDPVQAGDGWDQLLYFAPNGCVDTIGILVGYTTLTVDTLFFCASDEALLVDESSTGRTPWDGVWNGVSVTQDDEDDWYFDPGVSGVGAFILVYAANTCSDSLLVLVHPDGLDVDALTVCSAVDPFMIAEVPPGAMFSGDGVSATGVFDPAEVGEGEHVIYYEAPAGCSDSVVVNVLAYQEASIAGVQDTYCSNAIQVDVLLDPPGGVFTGLPTPSFSPSTLPDGAYTLIYTYGSGACMSADTMTFVDHPALTTTVTVGTPAICDGGGTTIAVVANGGPPQTPILFNWSDGLFPVSTQAVSPLVSTTYVVVTADGCSDPVVDSIPILVHPPYEPEYTFSAQQCWGEQGFALGTVAAAGDFRFTWGTTTPIVADSISLPAGSLVEVTVVNEDTGCEQDTLLRIPAWPPITSLFSSNPEVDCVPWEQREVTFIDLSNNAVAGYWLIDGDTLPYAPGLDPSYDHGVAGYYPIELVVWNEGGCRDSMRAEICIQDSEAIFLADVFSPNGDGNNDVFFARGNAIGEMELAIYDRWGMRVFTSAQPGMGWDGIANGSPCASGVYVVVLQATLLDGEVIERTHNVTLVR
jgi:gliding motility-associated-like protein